MKIINRDMVEFILMLLFYVVAICIVSTTGKFVMVFLGLSSIIAFWARIIVEQIRG